MFKTSMFKTLHALVRTRDNTVIVLIFVRINFRSRASPDFFDRINFRSSQPGQVRVSFEPHQPQQKFAATVKTAEQTKQRTAKSAEHKVSRMLRDRLRNRFRDRRNRRKKVPNPRDFRGREQQQAEGAANMR